MKSPCAICRAMLFLCIVAGTADTDAEIFYVPSELSVTETMDALEAAVEDAGATVFARVDHAAGANKAGLDLNPSQLLIFGNPKLGTPAMIDNALAGLYLPLKVLVYEDSRGQVYLTYEDPALVLKQLTGVQEDAAYLAKMTGALAKLTKKATAGSP